MYFIEQEEEELEESGDATRKYKRHIKSMNMQIKTDNLQYDQNNQPNIRALVNAPLQEKDIITTKEELIEGNFYLVVYIDTIDFENGDELLGDGKRSDEIEKQRNASKL